MTFPFFQQAFQRLQKAAQADPQPDTRRTTARLRLSARIGWTVALLGLVGNLHQYLHRYHSDPARALVTVGSRVVSLGEFQADLDSTAGKAVLNRLVYDEMIRQAAAKADVMPFPADVDARLAQIRPTTPDSPPPDQAARDQITVQLALENLRLRGITASDAEVAAFYAAHRRQFAVPGHVTSELVVTHTALAAHAATMLSQGRPKEQIAAVPGMYVDGVKGFHLNVQALPPAVYQSLASAARALPVGGVKVLQVGPTVFFVIQPTQRVAEQMPPLDQIRDEVTRQVRLSKAPSAQAEVASLYHAHPPTFDMARYAGYFSDVPPAHKP